MVWMMPQGFVIPSLAQLNHSRQKGLPVSVELLSRWLGAWPVLLILFQFDFHFQSASRSLRLLPPLPIPYDLSKSSDL